MERDVRQAITEGAEQECEVAYEPAEPTPCQKNSDDAGSTQRFHLLQGLSKVHYPLSERHGCRRWGCHCFAYRGVLRAKGLLIVNSDFFSNLERFYYSAEEGVV